MKNWVGGWAQINKKEVLQVGQYYMAVLGEADGSKRKVFNRSVDGEYTMAKLLEHSWWENPFVNSFSARLYKHKSRVAWVGDYANEPDDFKFANCSAAYIPCYKEVWREGVETRGIRSVDFKLDNKFLLNHDTKQFVNLNEYKAASADRHGWVIHPIPLLTAVGNDRGSGDFHEGGVGYEYVGTWAWQQISIDSKAPKRFEEFKLAFKERR